MYRNGLGTSVDLTKSGKLLFEAADKGVGQAQYLLGIDFYEGKYQERNYELSVKFLQMALDNKYVLDGVKGEICRKLSTCHRFGRGVSKNESKANEFISLAAKYGDADAQKYFPG